MIRTEPFDWEEGEGRKGVSIFAIDPGETTGWAWGCFGQAELKKKGVEGALKQAASYQGGVNLADRRLASGQIKLAGSSRSSGAASAVRESENALQILSLALVYDHMTQRVSEGQVPGLTTFVAEDFILRERSQNRDLLMPVRLNAMMAVLLHGMSDYYLHWKLQTPSNAKSVVTDDRLKELGLWKVGEQHARDALRHLVLYLRGIVNEL